jgi:hypothetical protein
MTLRRTTIVLAGIATAAVLVSGITASAASLGVKQMTIYSIAQQENFVNNADDRTRGIGHNPFGNFKDLSPSTQGNQNGPFPGDEAIFSFNLYKDAALTKRIGAATFTCQYDFDQDAFCDAAFHLTKQGTLIAGGTFNFNADGFTLVVTGGLGAYLRAHGVLKETPSAKHAQRLAFTYGS